MQDEGPVAAEAGGDRLAGLGVQADLARQGEEGERPVEVEARRVPAAWQTGALRLVAFLDRLAELHIGAEAAAAQRHVETGLRVLAEEPGAVAGAVLAIAVAVRRHELARIT